MASSDVYCATLSLLEWFVKHLSQQSELASLKSIN